jgi:hypothetical protein
MTILLSDQFLPLSNVFIFSIESSFFIFLVTPIVPTFRCDRSRQITTNKNRMCKCPPWPSQESFVTAESVIILQFQKQIHIYLLGRIGSGYK